VRAKADHPLHPTWMCRSGASLCFGTSVMTNVRRLMSIFGTVLAEEKRNGTEV